MNTPRLSTILKDLGKAELFADRELRNRSMEALLRLAVIGDDHLSRGSENPIDPEEAEAQPTIQKISRIPRREDGQLPFVAATEEGNLEGESCKLYVSNAYRSIVRALAKEGRVPYRPGNDSKSFWLKASEVSLVRRIHSAMYESNRREAANG